MEGMIFLIALLVLIAVSSLTAKFEDTEQFLYDSEFPDLNRRDFRALLNRGEWCNIAPGFVFATRNEPMEYLFYLLKGEVSAELPVAIDSSLAPRTVFVPFGFGLGLGGSLDVTVEPGGRS